MTITEVQVLETQWLAGERSMVVANRLLYFYWSSSVEPAFVTGLDELPYREAILPDLLASIHHSCADSLECCLTVGYLAWFAPWVFGNEQTVIVWAQTYLRRALDLVQRGRTATTDEIEIIRFYLAAAEGDSSNRPPPDHVGCFPDLFDGTSAYDDYFRWIFSGR